MTQVAVVVAAGEPPTADLVAGLDQYTVIAVDGGLRAIRALGWTPAVVVGDLDSAHPDDVQWAHDQDAFFETHPKAKDFTDLELALRAVIADGFEQVVVLGAEGGRPDHSLGNLSACAHAADNVKVEMRSTRAHTHFVTDSLTFKGEVGSLVSLLPFGGDVMDVSTTALRWRLTGATLSPFSAVGVSNEMAGPVAKVSIGAGTLLVVQPS